jgi:hypothetical protein
MSSDYRKKETPPRRGTPAQELPADEPLGALELVAYFNGAMPTGVTVSHQGRIFVNFPRWGDEVPFTVSEIRDGEAVAYPNEVINQADQNDPAAGRARRVRVDAQPVLLR